MKTNDANKPILTVEHLTDNVSVKLHFTDGTTLKMSRKAYVSGSWKNGTNAGLIAK